MVQKMVMKLTMEDPKKKAKALKTAVGVHGVVSVTLEADKIVVVGDVDSVDLTRILRRKMGHVELLSVAEEKKEEKKDDDKKGDDKPVVLTWPSQSPFPSYPFVISEGPYPYYREPAGCIIL